MHCLIRFAYIQQVMNMKETEKMAIEEDTE